MEDVAGKPAFDFYFQIQTALRAFPLPDRHAKQNVLVKPKVRSP